MLLARLLFAVLLGQTLSSTTFARRRTVENEKIRYSVQLSEPLESTLDWDFYQNDPTTLILIWNITLTNGDSGILAFSKYDLETENLDAIVFGNDEKLYNAYSDENSILSMPEDEVTLTYKIINKIEIEKKSKKKYSIQIIRPLDTCDKEKRNYVIDRGTIHLLTGLMNRDDFEEFQQEQSIQVDIKNMNLTLQRVQLLKSQASSKSIPDGYPHLDYLNDDVTIPDVETTYWCTRFVLPDDIMKKAHHIIRFDGIVSPQSEGIVHHMELFHCDVSPTTNIPDYNEKCTSEQKPMGLTPCRRVIGAWAMGATNFTYPEEAGGLIGGPDSSRFLVLEVHFNNPYLKKNIIDRSGIRIFYTPELRKYPAGIMEVGLEYNSKNSIPPGSNAFRISGYCTKECTQVGLPASGITVFASQLHTHLNGIEVFTRIIRKNGDIVTLNVDRHYSPHFQEIRLLPKPIRIKRGDTILHTCIYRTKAHTNMTFGGYGIKDEMCVNYMHYYPRTELELCKTSVRDDQLAEFFETMNEYDHSKTDDRQTVEQNYQSIRWTPLTAAILQMFYEIAPINLSCNGSNGNYVPKFDWNRTYLAEEPKQRDVPFDTDAKCK